METFRRNFLTGFKYPIHRFQNGRFFCKAIQLEVLSSLVPFFFIERLGGKEVAHGGLLILHHLALMFAFMNPRMGHA